MLTAAGDPPPEAYEFDLQRAMIQEPEQITIEAISNEAAASGNVLVSLGPITTELVINALK